MKRILGLFAHPDDEILGPGGTFAHYDQQGARVETICTTRGEAGEISDPSLATKENLGQVREQEMLCSANALGIQKVHFLGYRDSGMDGTPENQHPSAYINASDEEVTSTIVKIIRELRPHILLTFEPYGGYGHPDHIAINKHTHLAYTAAADDQYKPELGAAWQTPRLYYEFIPMSFFENMIKRMQAHGIETVDSEARFAARRQEAWPDHKLSCIMEISNTVSAKFAAYACHRTQFGEGSLFNRLPRQEMSILLSQEHFYLAAPETPTLKLDDLFDGIVIES